jgi:hypothetical protein
VHLLQDKTVSASAAEAVIDIDATTADATAEAMKCDAMR